MEIDWNEDSLRVNIKYNTARDWQNTFQYSELTLKGTTLKEHISSTTVRLTRQDIAEACTDYVEKKLLKLKKSKNDK